MILTLGNQLRDLGRIPEARSAWQQLLDVPDLTEPGFEDPPEELQITADAQAALAATQTPSS